MELSFVIAALRRRWWLIPIFASLGVWPLVLGGGPVNEVYESRALIEVLPDDDYRTTAGQPDRYIQSQLRVLGSRALAEEVAEKIGVAEEDVGSIQRVTTFEHIPDSDVIQVAVRQPTSDPGAQGKAQLIADAISETYIENLTEAETASRAPDLERYESALSALRSRLENVNSVIEQLYAPWLQKVGEQGFSLPPLNSIAIDEVAEQTSIINEINRIEALRSTLRDRPTAVNSSIVQPATFPGAPLVESGSLFEIALLLAMILLGVTATILWARFSPKVLDDVAAEEVIGAPMIASIQRSKSLSEDPLVAFTRLPQELIASIDQIAVQAEALAQINQTLTIAVVGTQRNAGATTTAVGLATRFAAAEYSVLLVDADRRDPWVTDVFGAGAHGGVPTLLGASEAATQKIFTRTSEPDVRVLGLGGEGYVLRRESAPVLVESTRQAANIVIFDAGPLLDAASTVELCNSVDAVVLAVPLDDQRTADLAAVARQLAPIRHKVLPVATKPVRGTASREPVATDLGADSFAMDGSLVDIAERRRSDAEQTPPTSGERRGSKPPPNTSSKSSAKTRKSSRSNSSSSSGSDASRSSSSRSSSSRSSGTSTSSSGSGSSRAQPSEPTRSKPERSNRSGPRKDPAPSASGSTDNGDDAVAAGDKSGNAGESDKSASGPPPASQRRTPKPSGNSRRRAIDKQVSTEPATSLRSKE